MAAGLQSTRAVPQRYLVPDTSTTDRGHRADLGVLYFFVFGGLGALVPYFPLLFASRGFTPQEIAWVMLLVPASTTFLPSIWGLMADALRARIGLLRIAVIGSGLSVLLLFPEWGVLGAAVAVAVHCFFRSPILAMADAATHATLGEDRFRFASIRVWGSVGFACFVTLVGHLDGARNPLVLVLAGGGAYLAAVVVTLRLDAPPLERERRVFSDTIEVLRHSAIPLLGLGSIFHYWAHSMFDVYFGLHLRSLGKSDAFFGTAWGIGVGSEIVLMCFAPLLLRRGRATTYLLIGSGAAVLRWGLLSVAESELFLLAVQPLHALTFGLWFLSMVKFVQDRAPDRLRTALQSVVHTTMGIGMMAGALSGGPLIEHYGGHVLFRWSAISAAVGFVVFVVLNVIDRKHDGPT